MLTERGERIADSLVTWTLFGVYVLMAYALSQHFGVVDGLAATGAFLLVMRAIGARTT